ncbi:sporangiospore maturation cell wall hydrolase GsmA [Longispora urticae]
MRSLVVLTGAAIGTFLVLPVLPASAAPLAGLSGAAVSRALAQAPTSAVVRTPGIPLKIRSAASATSTRVGTVENGTPLAVDCQVTGQMVEGTVRTTNRWDRLTSGGFVSDAYVARPAEPPVCGAAPAAPAAPREAGAFIASGVGHARRAQTTYGVPASVSLGQAILESGWGASELARVEHNLFGIKCFGWAGPIATGCAKYRTSECAGTRCYPTSATFRSYRSESDSYDDHGRFLRVNERYAGSFGATGNPDEFARRIAKAGYATDPRYADKVITLMKRYNLYQYDL